MEYLPVIARVIAGIVLLVAGIGKVRSRTWPVLAVEMGTPKLVVITLPAIEAVVGLALVLQVAVPIPSWIAVAMFVLFSIVVITRYFQKSTLPCNCFGGGKGVITPWTILRNIALVVVALVATA